MDKRIGFGNRVSVCCVSVFGLRWCGWGVGRGLDQGMEGWDDVMSV